MDERTPRARSRGRAGGLDACAGGLDACADGFEPCAERLDPRCRAAFAGELARTLAAHCPGSRAEPRGSLARGTADAYSDIDLTWTVPGDRFADCLADVRDVLGAVRPLDSLRTDPDTRRSGARRLFFAAFRGLPLFWRVDLEVVAARGDAGGPAAPADDAWSWPASALANAVAATKAVLRGRPEDARGLLERGLDRVDAPEGPSGHWLADIRRLADTAAEREPELRPLADRVCDLAERHRARLIWWALPAAVRAEADELILAGRNIQAVHAMRDSGIAPRPGLHACIDVLEARHRALVGRDLDGRAPDGPRDAAPGAGA